MRWSYLAVGKDLDSPRAWRFFAMIFPVPTEILRKRGREGRPPSPRMGAHHPALEDDRLPGLHRGARLARHRAAEEGGVRRRKERVREGTASNVFLLSGRRAATAPVSAALLPGSSGRG
jgi:hypothetical protein